MLSTEKFRAGNRTIWSRLATTKKKERERVREAMSKSLTAKPSRQAKIAEMMKGRLGAEERQPEEKVGSSAPVNHEIERRHYIPDDELEVMHSYEPSRVEKEILHEIVAGKFLDGFTETSSTGDSSEMLTLRRSIDVDATGREV